jgi:hypothetical protein
MLLLCMALGAVLQIAISAYRIRRAYRLHVTPEVVPTEIEHLPFAFRAVLGQLTQELAEMGFTAVANVCVREPEARRQTTQSLFANRGTEETASVFCTARQGGYIHCLYFSTQFSDGTEIATTDDQRAWLESRLPKTKIKICAANSSPTFLHEQHIKQVSELRPIDAATSLPAAGGELEYIRKEIAESRATMHGQYTLDRTGMFYIPAWRTAFMGAVAEHPVLRKLLIWRAKRRSTSDSR